MNKRQKRRWIYAAMTPRDRYNYAVSIAVEQVGLNPKQPLIQSVKASAKARRRRKDAA